MNLVNFTPFAAATTIITDQHCCERVLVVAKATFAQASDGGWTPAECQTPMVFADEHYGEPGLSSVRSESDFAFFKPRADILVRGSAYAPGGRPATTVDVELQLGSISKRLRVSGDRYWDSFPLTGWIASSPEPFVSMPILYERAFGGVDTSHEDERKHKAERRNLVGTGFNAHLRDEIRGTMLPNISLPGEVMRTPLDKVGVAGFGCVARAWEPRAALAGTYDESWMENCYPFLPADFNDRYFQAAPEDQTCDYLLGREPGRVTNLTPEGVWDFSVPACDLPIKMISQWGAEELATVIDTFVLLPDEHSCTVTWRASIRPKGKVTSILEIWVGRPTPGRIRAFETSKDFVDHSRN